MEALEPEAEPGASVAPPQPKLSVIVPTLGASTMARLLDSIRGQRLIAGDEIIIVVDNADDESKGTINYREPFGPAQLLRFDHTPGYHAFGHPQINRGMEVATGDYLVFNDDDDIFTPGAFDTIRALAGEQKTRAPLMFRFVDPKGRVYWRDPQTALDIRKTGGHSIVPPNEKMKLGLWTNRYEGDYDFVATTVNAHSGNAEICAPVISMARPELWWKGVESDGDAMALREIRNECRLSMTRHTKEIGELEQRTWWRDHDPERLQAFLFYNVDGLVGAGLLRKMESEADLRTWVTVMVKAKYRGKGIGKKIYMMLTCASLVPVWAEIRCDNAPSLMAAERAGFETVASGENVLMVKHPDVV